MRSSTRFCCFISFGCRSIARYMIYSVLLLLLLWWMVCYCFWELLTLPNTFSCFLIRWTLRSLLVLLLLLLLSLSRALSLFSMPCFFALMLLVGWFSLPLSVYVCVCLCISARATIAIVVIRAYYLPFHTPSFSSSSWWWWWWWWWAMVMVAWWWFYKSYTSFRVPCVLYRSSREKQSNAKAFNHPIHTHMCNFCSMMCVLFGCWSKAV